MSFKRGQLHYFVTVAEEGQMTRAAARLHIAQPALSQAISSLEAELGFKVLERHPRGVVLTAAGETFLKKARQAIAAETEAAQTARSLARAAEGALEIGFAGAPPGLHTPNLFERFMDEHPDVEIAYHELQFPQASMSAWLGEVDLAFSHRPPEETDVWMVPLRLEPRVVLAPRGHELAQAESLCVADVLDATFIGGHPNVARWWWGSFSLDDHRGAPPLNVTPDHVSSSQELFAVIAQGSGIVTLPACHAEILARLLPRSVVVPLIDAAPCQFVLVGREDHRTPLVESFGGLAELLSSESAAAAA